MRKTEMGNYLPKPLTKMEADLQKWMKEGKLQNTIYCSKCDSYHHEGYNCEHLQKKETNARLNRL